MAKVIVYTTNYCPYCVNVKKLFESLNIEFEEISLENNNELREKLSKENKGWRSVPMVFINDTFIGGFDDTSALHKAGKLLPMLEK